VWALHNPLSDAAAAALGLSASGLALLAAILARRVPFAGLPALVLGLVGAGSLLRVGGVVVVLAAGGAPAARSYATGWVAILAFACDALAVAASVAWVAARSKRVTSPTTIILLALALICTRQALRASQADDGQIANLLLWGASQRLMSSPAASVPLAFRVFVAFLAPMTAVACLTGRSALPSLAAIVALALAAHGAVEMPPCAWMLILAALAITIVSHDPRSVWDALARSNAGSDSS
jgi:hypothetical protein